MTLSYSALLKFESVRDRTMLEISSNFTSGVIRVYMIGFSLSYWYTSIWKGHIRDAASYRCVTCQCNWLGERHLVSTLLVEWYKYRSRNALKESRKKDEINKKDIAMTDVADKSIIHDFSLILRNLINLIRIQIKRNLTMPAFPYEWKQISYNTSYWKF